MSSSGCSDAFLPTQIHTKSSSWRHHNACRQKLESLELPLHEDNLPTSDDLGFPAIKSNEQAWLHVTLTLDSEFCSYR